MKKAILFMLLGALVFGSCKKEEAELNKQELLEFPIQNGFNTNVRDFITLPTYSYLVDFDKRDYPRVDSITFDATMGSTDTVIARLYNVTDAEVVPNSTISATPDPNNNYQYVHTNNLYKSLPDKKITLAIQMKIAGNNGAFGGIGLISSAWLKLRRN